MSARVRKSLNLGVNVRAKALTTVSDATSQKFILLGQLSRNDQREGDGRYTVIYLDFAGTQPHKCEEKDFERWYARAKPETECLMGIKVSPAAHSAENTYGQNFSNGTTVARPMQTAT